VTLNPPMGFSWTKASGRWNCLFANKFKSGFKIFAKD